MRTTSWLLVLMLAWSAPAAAQEDVQITDARIARALTSYRGEPPVQRLVRDALRARSATPGRVRDAMDRARATGWLPTVSGAVRRGQAIDLRALTGGDTPTNVSTGDDLVLEARLTLRLDRVVFAPEEPRLLRALEAAEAAEAEIVRTIVALYFERRRLQLERDLLGLVELPRALRILEIEALLDAFTDGAFHRIMRGRRGEG